MKVALNGASGFVASHLRKKYQNHVIIERDDSQEDILKKLEDVDVVFNLAGASIVHRWTQAYKKTLISSRIQTTQKLVNAINKSEVKHFISASAIGIYPDNKAYDESSETYGDDFLAQLSKEWEEQALRCSKATTIVRFGIILGADGGALFKMLLPFRLGLGGTIGSGSMMMSWIDIEDLLCMYDYIIVNHLTGVYNATSPYPVSNTHFTKALAGVLQRPSFFPLPEFVLKLLLGEGASVLTASKEVYPKAIESAGFNFRYKRIEKSLQHLLS